MSSIRNRRSAKTTAAEDILGLVRAQMAAAVEGGDPRTILTSALLIAGVARREAERDGDVPQLRQWHALLLDSAAAVREHSDELAQALSSAADAVRRTISLAARNPADQLASRPTSRRVLLAIHDLGGAGCPMTKVREKAEQSQTHFSNVLRPLRSAGLVTSEADPADGRERRLSLTDAGRAAIAGHLRGRTARAAPVTQPVPINERRPDGVRRPAPMRYGSRVPERYRSHIEVRPAAAAAAYA